MSEDQSITIGVDLGTTYSCVAIMGPAGPQVITREYDKRIFPSTFTIEDGVWQVGKHNITNRPSDALLVHNVKRAAIMASHPNIIATDVLSRSVGINTQYTETQKNDIMEVILKKNDPIPCSYVKSFTSVHTEETEIHLYEGKHGNSSENNSLGVFRIDVPGGQEIEVEVTATRHAEILVKASTAQGPKDWKVQRKESGLTASEIQMMSEKTQQRFDSDRNGQTMAKKRKRKRGCGQR